MLSALLFGCFLYDASAGPSCDIVSDMPDAGQVEGIEFLQTKGKKVSVSRTPSCLDLFKLQPPQQPPQQPRLSMLEESVETPVLPIDSDRKAKENAFNSVYSEDTWNGGSGPGSKVETTVQSRNIISAVLGAIAQEKLASGEQAEISMLDAPCGDMTWMPLTWKESEAARRGIVLNYHGGDVSTVVLQKDQEAANTGELLKRAGDMTQGSVRTSFSQIDLSSDKIGTYDLVFTKDLLGHLHTADIIKVLKNVKDSGSRYLLVTSRPDITQNQDVAADHFFDGHPVNVQIAPFNLGEPVCSDLQKTNDSPHVLALFDMAKLSSVGPAL